ncbi:hypothetical protein BDDG_11630 [Blastomyces dermatitidis ATCC 18188]|uniref:Uncharacterized protein n=1 Tax=Ajellomyces dermatitidis (strain ATCC 18188 / CBS 674.68) TaxID=653446 RepID=A0A0J9EN24_AJEDA|nr:hypothetical protein BDDG_11630 [Blastomyces dermatitidis ATCC 18188]
MATRLRATSVDPESTNWLALIGARAGCTLRHFCPSPVAWEKRTFLFPPQIQSTSREIAVKSPPSCIHPLAKYPGSRWMEPTGL